MILRDCLKPFVLFASVLGAATQVCAQAPIRRRGW